jgi:hypothetical protein
MQTETNVFADGNFDKRERVRSFVGDTEDDFTEA